MSQRPFVIGANYQTCPSGLRDKLFLDQEERAVFRKSLIEKDIKEFQIISTCDRVEFFGFHLDAEDVCLTIQKKLIEHAPSSRSQADEIFFRRYDDDAILHIFEVCTALHSQMIGEAQILGQIKEAYTDSQKDHCMGHDLDSLMQTAFHLAKRVRTQTKIGEGAVSVASAGVKLAKDLHGELTHSRGMIYGLGEAGQIMLDQFNAAGMHNWMLSGSSRRTERYAKRLNCHFVPEDDLENKLVNCDILITASGLGRFLLDDTAFKVLMEKRRYKPLLIIDCGVPLDIDPAVDSLDSLFRYSIEDLERLAERGQTNREKEASQARLMVQEAVIEYRRGLAEQDGIPALIGLREHFDKTRQTVLQEHPHLDATEATRLLINKLLHRPSEALRAMAADGSDADIKDWITVNRVLEQLFTLSDYTDNKEEIETEGE
ncbi:glutamyl-tRNA reductase [Curvivirga sp.]|uniref:glutamyl-tRNA reductase n=1 Tax=Curvivirga sp. TaxID=2856848 RepID=UPI003B5BA347